jgi:predicted lipid-binding transport protein (Tim44 family)
MDPMPQTSSEYTSAEALDTNMPNATPASSEQHRQSHRRGLRWLGVGVLLMGMSFAINFLLFDSGTSFTTIMYVMTTLGAICIIKCMADILGF